MEDTSARRSALAVLEEKGIPYAVTSSEVCFRFDDRDAVSNALLGLVDLDKYECSQQLSAERETLFRETLDKHGIPWIKDRDNTCIERRLGDVMQPVWHDFYTVVLPTSEKNPPEVPSRDPALDWTHGYSTKAKDIADRLARFLETKRVVYGQSRSMDSYVVYWRTDDPEEISMITDYLTELRGRDPSFPPP
jgi:hypothetical protein